MGGRVQVGRHGDRDVGDVGCCVGEFGVVGGGAFGDGEFSGI